MPSGSSFMNSGNPYEDMLRRSLQAQEELKAQELADRAAWQQAQVMAQIYGTDRTADSMLQRQQMMGEQELEKQAQGTSGLPFGEKKLASEENVGRYKVDAGLQKLLMMIQGQNERAQMGAASKQGKQLSFPDFLNSVVPRMKYPQGTDLVAEYMEMMSQFQNAQNPVRAQYMQGKMGPTAPQQW